MGYYLDCPNPAYKLELTNSLYAPSTGFKLAITFAYSPITDDYSRIIENQTSSSSAEGAFAIEVRSSGALSILFTLSGKSRVVQDYDTVSGRRADEHRK